MCLLVTITGCVLARHNQWPCACSSQSLAVCLQVTKKFGVPGLKAAMDRFGFYGGPTRSPLVALTDSELQALTDIFAASGFGQ